LPLLHPDLFKRFQHSTPKGFLLHGPPGCGKTLIGKATAYNLTQQLKQQTGEEMREYFMHIKGPEILNRWVGESERIVREIFATAREKRREGYLPFLFIDEAESILGTRRASRFSNILSTLVPMFCTEMDGIDSLSDVVIILASNRADLIDPAILRPGRIDRKIKVARPSKDGAREIYRIYLAPNLPYDPVLVQEAGGVPAAIEQLIDKLMELQFGHRDENRFLSITLRSGKKETLYRGDLVSGAIIASIVERAKGLAIKRAIASAQEEGISLDDLRASLDAEYLENDIFPPDDLTEDWLQLIDHDPENVVKVSPFRAGQKSRTSAPSTVI
jgi:proteasome-associated ATPase